MSAEAPARRQKRVRRSPPQGVQLILSALAEVREVASANAVTMASAPTLPQ